MHDRDYYRAWPAGLMLQTAVEDGLNPELAIAIAEELAIVFGSPRMVGQIHFVDNKEITK